LALQLPSHRTRFVLCGLALVVFTADLAVRAAHRSVFGPQSSAQLGGDYASLGARRQRLVDDWVKRFNAATRQTLEPGPFYDTHIKLSTKTTFDAITNALERTSLTDASGRQLGDALDLVESVQTTRGQVIGASGDRQFRMYGVLKEGTLDTLDRSVQFERGVDNFVYHKGYPLNYRQQGGVPSIQFSVALDGRRADIDVDYRSSNFPVGLFNGHLTDSNSDVRAGNNYERHANRWTGIQNWWRSLFGIRVEGAPPTQKDDGRSVMPGKPRVGNKNIDVMVEDFLKAWLVDGDMRAAMGYVAERSYACLAADSDDPFSVDLGIAPFVLAGRLRAAHDALGPRTSLEGLTVGVRLPIPALRVVKQPHHAQFVIYSVPDDVAAAFDCESRLTVGGPPKAPRQYGNYFGATFYVNAPSGKDHSIALLWGKNEGYWKIVSWKAEPAGDEPSEPDTAPSVKVVRAKADPTLAQAAKDFLETWLIRKDYDAAFRYLSPKSYPCYDLVRSPDAPASTSLADAGQKVRASLERAGGMVGTAHKTIDEVLVGVSSAHPAVRVLDHPYSRVFALGSVPDALSEALDCSAPERRTRYRAEEAPLAYGHAFGMATRIRTRSGETPVLRVLWLKEAGAWRITVYGIETP
jgi:hypothetical protein